jgi:3-hydroxybutyryl-CoA dehydratase
MSALPELRYDDLAVGRAFSDTAVVLSAEMLRDYAAALDDDNLLSEAEMGDGTSVSDPSILILFAVTRRVLAKDGTVPPGGVLARQDLVAGRHVRVGDVVTSRATVCEKYERRGRRYLVLRCTLTDAQGDVLGHVDNHIIWAR